MVMSILLFTCQLAQKAPLKVIIFQEINFICYIGLTSFEMEELDCKILLGNTYHLNKITLSSPPAKPPIANIFFPQIKV